MKMDLGENIRRLRKQQNITQEGLASALGVTVGAVHKWERNLSSPDLRFILGMAELFEVSTDVLLGYEWKNSSINAAVERIVDLRQNGQYDEAISEAEIVLKKYPNCFAVVYQSALTYSEKSRAEKNFKASMRALQFFEKACGLLPMSADEAVSEFEIRRLMAQEHLRLGNTDDCIEILKKHNTCGMNNAMIGMLLADCYHRDDEAAEYLKKAFNECIENLDSIVIGFANVFLRQKNYREIIDCMDWLCHILRGGYDSSEVTFFDKYECVLLVLSAETYCLMNDSISAVECLKQAKQLARRFDSTPESEIVDSKMLTMMGCAKHNNYNHFGNTAWEALENRVFADSEFVPNLVELWNDVKSIDIT